MNSKVTDIELIYRYVLLKGVVDKYTVFDHFHQIGEMWISPETVGRELRILAERGKLDRMQFNGKLYYSPASKDGQLGFVLEKGEEKRK